MPYSFLAHQTLSAHPQPDFTQDELFIFGQPPKIMRRNFQFIRTVRLAIVETGCLGWLRKLLRLV